MSEKIKFLLNGERYQFLFLIIACVSLLWFFGCDTEVDSVQDPSKRVNRDELSAELNLILTTYEKKFRELDQWDSIKNLAFQQAQIVASGSPLNWAGLIGTAAGIFGIGAVIDNTRKRSEIKKLKESLST